MWSEYQHRTDQSLRAAGEALICLPGSCGVLHSVYSKLNQWMTWHTVNSNPTWHHQLGLALHWR